jgi:hypothetical protein
MKKYLAVISILLSFNVFADPLAVNANIPSGWSKQVTYTENENVLTIEGRDAKPDADSINVAQFDNRSGQYSELVVTVQDISGEFDWGGKAIGISLSDTRLPDYKVGNSDTFIAPLGRPIEDNFIMGNLNRGEQLIFDLTDLQSMIFVGAKVYLKQGSILRLQFDLR